MCCDFLAEKISRAAVFSTDCTAVDPEGAHCAETDTCKDRIAVVNLALVLHCVSVHIRRRSYDESLITRTNQDSSQCSKTKHARRNSIEINSDHLLLRPR